MRISGSYNNLGRFWVENTYICTPLTPPTDLLGHGTLQHYSLSHPAVPSWLNVLPSLDSFGKSSSTDLELLAAGSLRVLVKQPGSQRVLVNLVHDSAFIFGMKYPGTLMKDAFLDVDSPTTISS